MTKLHKTVLRVNAISIKIPMTFYIELEQTILKFVWKHKKAQTVKANLRRTKLVIFCYLISNYTISDSNLKSMVLAQKHIYPWNRIENPEEKPTLTHTIS